MKPSKKEYKELKDFKLRVFLEINNAAQLYRNTGQEIHKVTIGNTTFRLMGDRIDFLARQHPLDLIKQENKFKTTKW